ncbi:mono-functional DNA-alkylating methyl methanesulfonate N-term-domain-containing protein [Chytriomyces sp. MP71]|nr:mono-functional DNA-alkylating methyl methanesulfonate N-term-domain-containing protein [Chytriomyces sp. MP71]
MNGIQQTGLCVHSFRRGQHASFHHPLFARVSHVDSLLVASLPLLVVASSDAESLAFLKLSSPNSALAFESVSRMRLTLPDSLGNEHAKLGAAIAVDPLNRAMVVSAYQGAFKLFVVDSFDPYDPVHESNSTLVLEPGFGIWDVVFLYPDPSTPDIVTLAVIVCKDASHSLVIFEHTLGHDSHLGGPSLARYGPFPIPSSFIPVKSSALRSVSTSLFLVSESMDALCVKVERSLSKSLRVSFPMQKSIVEAFLLTEEQACAPLITGISPCPMHNVSTFHQDAFYVASDAGHLARIDIVTSTTRNWTCATTPLSRRNPSTHLIVLDTQNGEDALALLGDMCDGEILTVNYNSHTVTHRATLGNTAPIIDFRAVTRTGGDTLYLTSGTAPRGCIRAIQRGIHASVEVESEAEFEGVTQLWNLRSASQNSYDSFLCIGLLSATRLFHLLDDTLEDISSTSGFRLDAASLTVAAVNGGEEGGLLVQVWAGGVVVARPSFFEGEEPMTVQWTAQDSAERVLFAAVEEDFICIYLGGSRQLVLLRVISHGGDNLFSVSEVSRTAQVVEPSCLHFSGGHCFVGTYSSELLNVSVDDSGSFVSTDSTLLLNFSSTGVERIPHSFCVLMCDNKRFLVVGLRDGSLRLYSFNDVYDAQLLDNVKLGNEPPRLVGSGTGKKDTLVMSDKLWTLQVHRNKLVFDPVCFDGAVAATHFKHTSHQANSFIFATNSTIAFVDLSSATAPHVRSMPLSRTPKRILYDAITETLIVACNMPASGGVLTGEIRLVCPKSGTQYLRESLPHGEAVYSMTAWNIKDGKRYFCVGTWGLKESASSSPVGRVLVYSLKMSERSKMSDSVKPVYRIKQLGEYRTHEMVFSVCPFLRSYLLAASGNCLYQLKIEATSRTLHCGAKTELRYPIRSLSVSGSLIFVGGSNDSVSLYLFDPKTKHFTLKRSDSLARSSSDCLALSDNQVLVADKSGEVFCLSNPSGTASQDLCFKTMFSIQVGDVITRLHSGQLDAGFDGCKEMGITSLIQDARNSLETEEIDQRSTQKVNAAFGTSITGGVFAFWGLTEEAYARLFILQNVLVQYPATQSLIGQSYTQFRATGHHSFKNVIDGDLLKLYHGLSFMQKVEVCEAWQGTLKLKGHQAQQDWLDAFVDVLLRIS